jgi:hypothetical protein
MKDPVKAQRSESRAEAERQLDEALEESFPASDPLPTTRMRLGAPEHPSKVPPDRRAEGRGDHVVARKGTKV